MLLSIVLTASAIPAKKGVKTDVQLVDGRTVTVELCGDENFHFWRDQDGVTYMKAADGIHFEQRNISSANSATEVARKESMQRRMARLPMNNPQRKAAYTGTKKGLVILMQFQNKQFQSAHNQEFYNRMCNEVGFNHTEAGYTHNGSVHDYFLAQSGGQFDLTFDVVGPFTAQNNYEYYGQNVYTYGNRSDAHAKDLIKEAANAANAAGVDFTQYDWDNDGLVDQVFVLYAGDNEAYGGSDENTIWPHESSLWPVVYVSGSKRVSTYACASEMTYTMPNGIGTFCHEFTHCLGIMDMYDTDYDETGGTSYGMGSWDLMSQGSDNNYGYTPAGYTSYEKYQCGWLTPITLTGEQEITNMKALSEGGEAYIIYNKANNNEFYMLENRQKTGWDAALPGNGLLILHVDYSQSIWRNNQINIDPTHQRVTIFHADNKDGTSQSDEANDPYPYRANNKLTNTSAPAARLFNSNSGGTKFMNYPISGIKQENGLVSFYAGIEVEDDDPNGPTVDPTGALFYESFDQCDGEGCNDNLWGLSSLGGGTFLSDNTGWFYNTGAAYGADRCARFGTNRYKGTVRTPSITIDGTAKLYFKAAAWSGDGTGLKLTVTDGAQLSDASFTMTEDGWTNYESTITGSGDITITFWPDNRFFLDEVVVLAGDPTGIKVIDKEQIDNNAPIYNLAGQRVSDSYNGIVIVNGKKTVRK